MSARTEQFRAVSPWWLPLLAGPLSFGITGPTLVLADVARDLDVTLAAATSMVTAFGWGVAVGTPLMGVLLARRGVRATALLSALLLLAGALLVLAVPALPALAGGSALQALGAAGATVVALSLAGSAGAMGLVTSSLAVFGAVAPLVGSQVAAAVSWQAALVLPLLSLLALPAVLAGAGAGPREPAGRFDVVGALLLVGLVTALVLLTQQPLAAGLATVVLAVLLGLHLRRTPRGFVPVAALTAPRFMLSAGLGLLLAVVNFAIVYASPAMLTANTGWTAGALGTAMLVPYLAGGALSWFLVSGSARLRYPVLLAVLAAAAATALALATLGGSITALVFGSMLVGSLAASTGQGALGLHAGASVPAADRPAAMGLFTLCYLLGAAFGPAIAALATS